MYYDVSSKSPSLKKDSTYNKLSYTCALFEKATISKLPLYLCFKTSLGADYFLPFRISLRIAPS